MDDIVFTFDTAPFLTGVSKISEGFKSMMATVGSAATSVGTAITSVQDKHREKSNQTKTTVVKNQEKMGSSFRGMASGVANIGNFGANAISGMGNAIMGAVGKVGMLAAGYMGVRAIMGKLPEVGQAFSIAGDIINKNLFWPLRQELIPMLQSMLNWVTKNRTMFLSWGVVIRNVFRAIVSIVKSVIAVIKKMFEEVNNYIKSIFGTSTRTVGEAIKILIFKLFVLAQFILMILEPVFKMIGNWIGVIITAFRGLVDGFKMGVPEIVMALADFGEALKSLAEVFTVTGEAGRKVYLVFKGIGQILSGMVTTAIGLATAGIDNMVMRFKQLGLIYDWIKAKLSGGEASANATAIFKKQFAELEEAGLTKLNRNMGTVRRGIGRVGSGFEQIYKGATESEEIVEESRLAPAGYKSKQNNVDNSTTNQTVNVTVNKAEDVGPAVQGAQEGMSRGSLVDQRNRQ